MDRSCRRPAGLARRGRTVNAGPILLARDLHKSFGVTPALRGADLSVGGGEMLAVTGPSGSGKSTLLHCVAGILTPDSGEVVFDGRRVDRMSDRERTQLRRVSFGFVFQFGQLVPELPAVENVALPLLLAGRGRGASIRTAERWFPRLGLEGLEQRLPGELSGGQSQRVAIARAMVAEPKVIFADEPTGALDSVAADQVMDLLVQAARDTGTSVVVVTHQARVAAFADDHFRGRELFRVDVAALGARPPVPPGLTRLPGQAEIAVSPALRALLARTPYDQYGGFPRWPRTGGCSSPAPPPTPTSSPSAAPTWPSS
ncbi:ABC transporter ATP-binding protein [Streptosporangiaceae bacterium NEAU-GS5]|nr:ABC transporter ATP-binding protein [Streptosporangiaceae bacterium NEAU-GS5]